jgi:hypothetical protein
LDNCWQENFGKMIFGIKIELYNTGISSMSYLG